MKYLLDTDTVSHLVRGSSETLIKRATKLGVDEAAISVVTRGELAYGAALKPLKTQLRATFDRILGALNVLPLGAEVGIHYGEIRAALRAAGQPIGPNDLWIAAHARALKLTLVTHNVREFQRVPGLKVEDWL
jgi:tRNA(fMet)-specific endonuclease VapC